MKFVLALLILAGCSVPTMTIEPQATYTPRPTYTPLPTSTPRPTATAYPTPSPNISIPYTYGHCLNPRGTTSEPFKFIPCAAFTIKVKEVMCMERATMVVIRPYEFRTYFDLAVWSICMRA